MPMRFAFETVVWGRRIDDLDFVLDAISACGYQGVEFAQTPSNIQVRDGGFSRPIRDIDELLQMLRSRNLELVSLVGGTLEERMKFCGDFRPHYLYVDDWTEQEAAAMSYDPPFMLALHPHWFMKVQRVSQAEQRLREYKQRFPGAEYLKLLPDTAHLAIAENDAIPTLERLRDQLGAIYLKDWKPSFGRYSHRYAQGFVALGQGIVKVGEVLEQLRVDAFDKWIVVEQDYAYTSPLENAANSAQYLAQQGFLPKLDQSRINELLKAEAVAAKTSPATGQASVELSFLKSLSAVTSFGFSRFYTAAVEAFAALDGVEAVQLFAFLPTSDELHLLAAAGLKSIPCKTRIRASQGLTGEAVAALHNQVKHFDLAESPNIKRFEDVQLLASLHARRMISVPIANHSNPHDLRFVVNIFTNEGEFQHSDDELLTLGQHMSRLAGYVTDAECSAASVEAAFACGRAKTRREFLVSFVGLLKKTFNCEGVSVLLVNETGDRLELIEPEGTTGVIWNPSLPLHDRYYSKNSGLTGTVWHRREVILSSDVDAAPERTSRCAEILDSPHCREALFAPMLNVEGQCSGVIRLLNKMPTEHAEASMMFTNDDVAVLDSIIQAALPHLEQITLRERQLSAISRMTHEFQVPVVAIRGASDHMLHTLNKQGKKPVDVFGEDYIGDIQQWSKLIGRLASNARVFSNRTEILPLSPSSVLLMSQVIAPVTNQVQMLLKERRFKRDSIHLGDFKNIPRLHIDRNQFQQVFFNLLSNSIKYADNNGLEVRIEGGKFGSGYVVWYEDWGPGIEEGSSEIIFQPGYRAREAMHRDVAGQGIGLFVVRSILEAHGGSIRVTNIKKPLRFEISLPESLRFPKV